MNFQECKVGWKYETDSFFILFGNCHSQIENLKKEFSDLEFKRIKQTHSDICVFSSDQLIEADAQITKEKKEALVISTADCMPVMIYCPTSQQIAAVHAGWRGIQNQIIMKTINLMILNGAKAESMTTVIGPHILQKSFEVEEPVCSQLQKSSYNQSEELYQKSNNKYFVDLLSIAKSQMNHLKVSFNLKNCLLMDTKTNLNLHSYRRDKQQSGRNLSFICLK